MLRKRLTKQQRLELYRDQRNLWKATFERYVSEQNPTWADTFLPPKDELQRAYEYARRQLDAMQDRLIAEDYGYRETTGEFKLFAKSTLD